MSAQPNFTTFLTFFCLIAAGSSSLVCGEQFPPPKQWRFEIDPTMDDYVSSHPEAHYEARDAIAKINDPTRLAEIATNDDNYLMRIYAVEKLNDKTLLSEIAKYDISPDVRGAARNRLREMQEEVLQEKATRTSAIPDPLDLTIIQRFSLEGVQPEPQPPAIANETAQPTPPEQLEKTSSNKTILWVAVIAFLAAIGGAVVWRKKS